MQIDTCIKELSTASGVSLSEISRRLGKSRVYASNVAAPGRSPALATVADIADVLDYRLAVVDVATGKEVGTIEPPRKAAQG